MKVAKYKLQVQSATNNPSVLPLLRSPCTVWICPVCLCRVLFVFLGCFFSSFWGHSCSLNFLSVLLCPTTNLLSVRPKWLHLPVSIFSISCPQSSFCPACCSPSWLLASAQVGSLPWRVTMACNHCLHQFGGGGQGTWTRLFSSRVGGEMEIWLVQLAEIGVRGSSAAKVWFSYSSNGGNLMLEGLVFRFSAKTLHLVGICIFLSLH